LDKLENFASRFGADFYGLPHRTETVTLRRETWELPREAFAGDTPVVPLRAGEAIGGKFA
ncbi:dihydroorotase, partial [Burkholderia sp. SIMBA_024]